MQWLADRGANRAKLLRLTWARPVIVGVLALALGACGREYLQTESREGSNPERLQIWWAQGFLPEENAAITSIVSDWENQPGQSVRADLRLVPDSTILQEIERAIEAGQAPDVVFSFNAETNLFPRLAWAGHLAELSDAIEPLEADLSDATKQAVSYFNRVTGERNYYAVPLGLQSVYIHYWGTLLEGTGRTLADVPTDWQSYWEFWPQVQQELQPRLSEDLYAIGFPVSTLGTDTFWAFEQFMEAYDVRPVNPDGTLNLDTPTARSGLERAIADFSQFYRAGYIPPAAIDWTDGGNNVSFLDSESLMTANSTLSIPLTQLQPDTPYNTLSRDIYYNHIVTTPWPRRPDGEPLRSVVTIKQVVVLADASHPEAARDFVAFLMQEENLDRLLFEGNKGRIFPPRLSLLEDSFADEMPLWTPNDPHLSAALDQLTGPVRPSYQVFHPAYSEVLAENIWAKAVQASIQGELTPAEAADEAIARIEEIFERWGPLNDD